MNPKTKIKNLRKKILMNPNPKVYKVIMGAFYLNVENYFH